MKFVLRMAMTTIILLSTAAITVDAQQVVRVTGIVVDKKSGEPIPEVNVTAYMQNRPNSKFTATTDKDGRFIVTRLSPGMAIFEFEKDGYEPFGMPRRISSTNPRIVFNFTMVKIEREEGTVNAEIRGRYDEATELFKAGRLDEALVIFEELLEQYPDLHMINLNVGIIMAQREDYDKALENFRAVLEKEPENADVVIYIAEVYLKKEDYESALEWYQKGADLNPEFFWAVNQTADVARFLEKYDVAVEYYRRAVVLDASQPLPHLFLGTIQDLQQEYSEALDHLLKYIELDPQGAAVSSAKGLIDDAIDNYNGVEDYFRRVVAEDDTKPMNRFYLGRILAEKGGADEEAVQELNKYLELDPDNNFGFYEKANELLGALQ